MELKDRITVLKQHFKLTNSKLGELAGISGQAVSDIETGVTSNPKVSVFQNIAINLGVSIQWLVLGQGEMVQQLVAEPVTSYQKATTTLHDKQSNLSSPVVSLEELTLKVEKMDLQLQQLKEAVEMLVKLMSKE